MIKKLSFALPLLLIYSQLCIAKYQDNFKKIKESGNELIKHHTALGLHKRPQNKESIALLELGPLIEKIKNYTDALKSFNTEFAEFLNGLKAAQTEIKDPTFKNIYFYGSYSLAILGGLREVRLEFGDIENLAENTNNRYGDIIENFISTLNIYSQHMTRVEKEFPFLNKHTLAFENILMWGQFAHRQKRNYVIFSAIEYIRFPTEIYKSIESDTFLKIILIDTLMILRKIDETAPLPMPRPLTIKERKKFV